MTPRVRALYERLPEDIQRDITAVAGYCRIGGRGICERCYAVELATRTHEAERG